MKKLILLLCLADLLSCDPVFSQCSTPAKTVNISQANNAVKTAINNHAGKLDSLCLSIDSLRNIDNSESELVIRIFKSDSDDTEPILVMKNTFNNSLYDSVSCTWSSADLVWGFSIWKNGNRLNLFQDDKILLLQLNSTNGNNPFANNTTLYIPSVQAVNFIPPETDGGTYEQYCYIYVKRFN